MLKLHNYMIIIILLLLSMNTVIAKTFTERVAELELERISHMNLTAHNSQQRLNATTTLIEGELTGSSHGIDFSRKISQDELTLFRLGVLNKYVKTRKIDNENYKFNDIAFGKLNKDLLNNPQTKQAYNLHLFGLYIMEYAADKLANSSQYFLYEKDKFHRIVASDLLEQFGNRELHQAVQDNFMLNSSIIFNENFDLYKHDMLDYYGGKLSDFINGLLGDTFIETYHALIFNLKNKCHDEKAAINMVNSLNLSPYNSLNHNNFASIPCDYKFNVNENVIKNLRQLKNSENEILLHDLRNSQSVHIYNNKFIKPNKDVLNNIIMSQELTTDHNDLAIIYDSIKTNMLNDAKRMNMSEDFQNENHLGQNFNNLTTSNLEIIPMNVENIIKYTQETFSYLDRHFLRNNNYIENSETGLNVLDLLYKNYHFAVYVDKINNEKYKYVEDNIEIFKSEELKDFMRNYLIQHKMNLFQDFIVNFARNLSDGGWCFPGIAGRLFMDRIVASTKFVLNEPGLFKTTSVHAIKEKLQKFH